MPERMTGKVAIITGAARGIGRSVAEAMCAEGAKVMAVDLLVVDAPESESIPDRWRSFQADVSDPAAVQAMVHECTAVFGPPDILVNMAAISTPSSVSRLSLEQWDQTLRVNLTSVFLCTKAVLPMMIERSRGVIISFSSVLADVGGKGNAHYAAAKAGVEAFSKSLAREVSPHGIRVNVISPGMVDTPMLDLMDAQQKETLSARIPLKRIGQPADLVEPVLFLASEGSTYITGQVIRVDGGMNMA
ncbi:MAG: SDR family NAD(P)-dependent oxidoreductase [Desulfomonilia bacterium]|nr:SDR family NAD(P)-dependent oxidoreductase [Desulfomonilia bacterium]